MVGASLTAVSLIKGNITQLLKKLEKMQLIKKETGKRIIFLLQMKEKLYVTR